MMVKSMELPNGWAWATLDQLAKGRSQSVDPSKYRSEKFELYSIPGFDSGSPEYLAGEEIGSTKQLVGEGDVLISKINPRINRVWLVGKGKKLRKIASTEWIVFPRNDCVDGKYLKCFLRQHAVRNFLATNVSGVGGSLMRVKPSTFDGYRIPIAPLSEQRRIVEKIETLFAELDKGEESLRQVQVLLARYRQSVLKAAVTGELTADWRAQRAGQLEHGRDLLARILKARRENWQGRGKYKEPVEPDTSNLPELPDGWVWATVEQVIDSARNGLSKKPTSTPNGFPILRISTVRPMSVDVTDIRYYPASNVSEVELFWVEKGDLLFTRYNGSTRLVGVCGQMREESPVLYPDKLIRVRLVDRGAFACFVEMAWNTGETRNYIASRIKTTSGQQGVSGTDIKAAPFPLPPFEEQRLIAGRVQEAFERIEALEASCVSEMNRSTTLRQSILKDAFSGRLVPQDPDDEPASELLARIRAQRAAQPEKSERRKTSA